MVGISWRGKFRGKVWRGWCCGHGVVEMAVRMLVRRCCGGRVWRGYCGLNFVEGTLSRVI